MVLVAGTHPYRCCPLLWICLRHVCLKFLSVVANTQFGTKTLHLVVQTICQLTKRERPVTQERNLFLHSPQRVFAALQLVTL